MRWVIRSRVFVVLLFTALVALVAVPAAADDPPADPTPASAGDTSVPERNVAQPGDPLVLAHYYMWFNASSWNRAKTDYPLIGRYSSDQASVMRTQVQQAKASGIDGFIVSWKSTDDLDRRLAQLVQIAREESFKLAITYQALDFNRNPLPPDRIAADLDYLAAQYGTDSVFNVLGGQLLVVWTGTWAYSHDEIASVTSTRRPAIRFLATARNIDDYVRVADTVDGELYYWSSVDPFTNDRHESKLTSLANEVRSRNGMWIAPVAPGYDARLVGGKSVVERRNGDTLRANWSAALATVPDAIGIISWNEFSENTYIEPSKEYGTRYLDTVRSLTHAARPSGELDSDQPAGRREGPWNLLIIGAFVVFVLGVGVAARLRRSGPSVQGAHFASRRA